MRLRYAWRIWPATTEIVPLLLGVAWTAGSHLDTPFERTVLIIASTLGLSCAFVEPAAAVTAASPTTLRSRRALPGMIAFVVAVGGWTVMRWGAALSADVGGPELVEVAEWTAIAATQIAVGLVAARERDTPSIVPGMAVALVWAMLAGIPDLHEHVYPVGDHAALWAGALVASVLVAVVATVDPARKPFSLPTATREVSEQRSLP